jgi:hypothetical protein
MQQFFGRTTASHNKPAAVKNRIPAMEALI